MTVARVAEREGWDDPAAPPASHDPRTLDEEAAVARFAAAQRPARRARARLAYETKVRLGLILAAIVVLGACWWVSPTRTALGLMGAGLVCLVAMRRRRRRATGRAGGVGPPRAFGGRFVRPW